MGQLFDSKADSYDKWYSTPGGRIVDGIEKEALFTFLEPRDGMRVLDIGCGTGNYSLALAKAGLKVTGIDISPAMLEKARITVKARGLKVSFLEGDALQLPFRDNSFDAVISATALEFVPDLDAALGEAYRVLKPGGRLVVGVIGRDSAWGRFYREKASLDPGSVFAHARLYSLKELRDAMPGKQVQARAVLFVPPNFDFSKEQEAINLEAEAVKTGRTDGGFICAVSRKHGNGS